MNNVTLNRLLDLPNYLLRHQIYHSEGFQFGVRWLDNLIRTFDSFQGIKSINYPVDIYIESKRYSGELEVRRDGTHALHMTH